MGDFLSKHKYLIIIILCIIIATCGFFLFFKPETDEQREWREFSESITKSKQEYEEFVKQVDKKTEEKLKLFDEMYNK